ncbi:hypothetical protein HN51_015522, partial [Arachis hypogaea]
YLPADPHLFVQSSLLQWIIDLNCRPLDENTNELIDKKTNVESLPDFGAKKRRAQSDHIAKIALPNLVKSFKKSEYWAYNSQEKVQMVKMAW